MNKIFWLLGLPLAAASVGAMAGAITGAVASPVAKPFFRNLIGAIAQKPVTAQALPLQTQPSTVISIDTTSDATSGDRIAHPPVRQTFTAEPATTASDRSGAYRLVISAEDNWNSPIAKAKLFQGETALWEESLPHQYGPRFVLIGANGNVLLLDEFINVASPHAITLINKKGQTIAQHGFKDIQATLNLPTSELTKQATTGWWISAAPLLIEAGNCAVVPTGDTLLEINLVTGTIGPRDPSTL